MVDEYTKQRYFMAKEPLPVVGSHYWLEFAGKPGRTPDEITRALNRAGLIASAVRNTRIRIGTNSSAYIAAIEPTINGVRPVDIAQTLGVNVLVVLREPVDSGTELQSDLLEWTLDQESVPTKFAPAEYVFPKDSWHAVLITFPEGKTIPTMAEIQAALNGLGVSVFDTQRIGLEQGLHELFFYIHTGNKVPVSGAMLAEALGAQSFEINQFPAKLDVGQAQALAAAKEGGQATLNNLAMGVSKLTSGLGSLVAGAGGLTETLADTVLTITKFAGPILLGIGAWWAYNKFKRPTRDEEY